MKIISLLLISFVTDSATLIISSSPGLQRKHIGEKCEFQWTVTGEVTSYFIRNMTTGNPSELIADHSNHSRDVIEGVQMIRLLLFSIDVWDAGNYSLSVVAGATTTTNAGALLFVYGSSGSSSVTSVTSLPATEGNRAELSCTVTTTSRPPTPSYRPRIYYFWRLANKGTLKNISSGNAVLGNGQVLTRYFISNDGRTLAIESLQYSDQQSITCWGQEEGSRYRSSTSSSLSLSINYRPILSQLQPVSGKVNVNIGQTVSFSFNYQSSPSVSILPTWTFINSDGIAQTLPDEFSSLSLSNPFSVSFTLLSAAYYGRYYLTIGNTIGSTNGSFSVLPPGPPDSPSDLTVQYRTSRLISVEWKCQWFNGLQQTIFVQLKDTEKTGAILDSFNQTESDEDCYNQNSNHLFQKDLQPDRNYEISAWSNNSLGSSDEIKLSVRTTQRFQLLLSQETISINENKAKVDYRTMNGNMTELSVTCCAEETGVCLSEEFQVNSSSSEIVLENLPAEVVFLFDFVAFGTTPGGQRYFLGMIKGVKVHRDGNPSEGPSSTVVVLACLLAFALVVLVVCLSVFLCLRMRRRGNEEEKQLKSLESSSKSTTVELRREDEKTPKTKQQSVSSKDQRQRRALPDPKAQPLKIPSPDEGEAQETYEAMERVEGESGDGEMYTPLDQPQPQRKQKRNLYS